MIKTNKLEQRHRNIQKTGQSSNAALLPAVPANDREQMPSVTIIYKVNRTDTVHTSIQ